MLLNTAVELDHIFGLIWLPTELSWFGYSSSIKEVTPYKQSVACNENMEYLLKCAEGSYNKYSGDNAKHNAHSHEARTRLCYDVFNKRK